MVVKQSVHVTLLELKTDLVFLSQLSCFYQVMFPALFEAHTDTTFSLTFRLNDVRL